MRLFDNPGINFVGKQKAAAMLSGVLIVLSLIALFTRGLETGIDFLGGTEIVVETDGPLSTVDIRSELTTALGASPEVKEYGADNLFLIRTPTGGDPDSLQAVVISSFENSFPGSNARPEKVDSISPRFADDLKRGAIKAIFASLLVIFLYILVRFGTLGTKLEYFAFPIGAVAALIHDVIIVLGIFAMLHHIVPFSLQIDQAIIAALLTIVGYSLNDTVVIFDRIREFTNLFKTERYSNIVNKSINSTLSRTMVTSGTTLIVVCVLFFFGGEVLKGFAFALIVGVLIGTYSSIFVASPVVMALRTRAGRSN